MAGCGEARNIHVGGFGFFFSINDSRPRIPDLATPQRETRAWNNRINRARTRINWQLDRRAARRKFGYKRNSFTRPNTSSGICHSKLVAANGAAVEEISASGYGTSCVARRVLIRIA